MAPLNVPLTVAMRFERVPLMVYSKVSSVRVPNESLLLAAKPSQETAKVGTRE
ncbi:MAG: hypothetical protein IT383_04990 [Deltaproteobacteria bacterium]|nr:hypothetical protein [Deltaproteobacteria bacterium]